MEIGLVDVGESAEDRARTFLGPRPEGVSESVYLSAVLSVVSVSEQLAEVAKAKAAAATPQATPPGAATTPSAADGGRVGGQYL